MDEKETVEKGDGIIAHCRRVQWDAENLFI
jgi:hypothetical protein